MNVYVYNCGIISTAMLHKYVYIPTYMTKFIGIYIQICIYHMLRNII